MENIEIIKNMIEEELTDDEAKELLRKINKARIAEAEGKPYLTFDWGKAIMLIFAYNIKNAAFGLKGDWDASSAIGLQKGKPVDPLKQSKFGFCLTSNWGIPHLLDLDSNKCYECYKELSEDELIKHSYISELWWPDDAKVSFDFVKEIMEDLS